LTRNWAEQARGRFQDYLRSDHTPKTPPPPMDPNHSTAARVLDEIRWSFTAPRHWLEGVAANVALSLLYLLVSPLATPRHTRFGWVVLVGTYFATFILADVTTTNVLGLDIHRVRTSLANGMTLRGILLTKNLTLLIIVGLPTLVLTAVLARHLAPMPMRFTGTMFLVLLPLLCWLGVGNIISALLPVETRTLAQRWRERRSWRTAIWIFHLVLPYALYYLVAPIDGTQHDPLLHFLPHHSHYVRAPLNAGIGLLVWIIGTAVAVLLIRRRGLRCY
jgi:hypothetical protein